jgi:hypothetical protein
MARKPATVAPLMGVSLLAAIGAGTVTRVTEAQAASLDASHFEVNTADVVDGAAAVRITEAGTAALAAQPPVTAVSGGIAIDDDVPMPEGQRNRAPRETIYPFDKLEVGQSFHVAKTEENPDPAIRLSSSVSGAHVRYSPVLKDEAGNVLTETYESPVYKKTADGKGWEKDPTTGKRVVESVVTKTREQRGEPTREFFIVPTDATDKRGEGARVFRRK